VIGIRRFPEVVAPEVDRTVDPVSTAVDGGVCAAVVALAEVATPVAEASHDGGGTNVVGGDDPAEKNCSIDNGEDENLRAWFS
jgi:hypothetical protein